MMDFIDFEATVDNDSEIGNKSDEACSISSVDPSIVDIENNEDDVTTHYQSENVSKLIDDTLAQAFDEIMERVDGFEKKSNFCKSSEEEAETDDYKDVEKRIDKFKHTLHIPNGEDSISSFFLCYVVWNSFFKY